MVNDKVGEAHLVTRKVSSVICYQNSVFDPDPRIRIGFKINIYRSGSGFGFRRAEFNFIYSSSGCSLLSYIFSFFVI
jgi:hypothetical protein